MPRDEFILFFSGGGAAFVDVGGGGFDEGGDTATGDFFTEGDC